MDRAKAGPPDGGVVGVVVHPARKIDRALGAIRSWAESRGGSMGQIAIDGQDRRVADLVEPADCSLVIAVGGDGTVLAALHAAVPSARPVLGVACGSLGALTSVKASDIATALERVTAGEERGRMLPALRLGRGGADLGLAFNDVVVVRRGAGQVIVEADVDGEPYARLAGDGVIIATPLGSSGYTLAAGGPLLAASAPALVLTPIAPHGGSVPPVVLGDGAVVTLRVDGGWSGARIERDGGIVGDAAPGAADGSFVLEARLEPQGATLLDLDGETLVAGLRRRGVIADSPRLAARDARAKKA